MPVALLVPAPALAPAPAPTPAATPRAPVPVQRPNLAALHGLRGLAILFVLLAHSVPEYPAAPWPSLAGRVWFAVCNSRPGGVDLFFVLSGFLITGILLDSCGKPGYYRSFFGRRTLRIVPVYFAALAVAFWVLPRVPVPLSARATWTMGGSDSPLWLWCFLTNVGRVWRDAYLRPPTWAETGHFWSLAVEQQFYLAWPLVVALCPRRRLPGLCVWVLAGAFAARLVVLAVGNPLAATLMPCQADALAAGAWLACRARAPGGLTALVPVARWVGGVTGAFALAVLAGDAAGARPDAVRFSPIWGVVMWLLYGAVLVLAVTARPGSAGWRLGRQPWLHWLGRYSYAIYVFHFMPRYALEAFVERLPVDGPFQTAVAYFALQSALACALAWVSWRVLEGPLNRYKDRWFPVPR